jgi:hypothetical protein
LHPTLWWLSEGLTLDVPPKRDCALWVEAHYENKSPNTLPTCCRTHLVKGSSDDEVRYRVADCWFSLIIFIPNFRDRITSYINNLHCQHRKDLYGVIEKIIAKAIPFWNMTLTPLQDSTSHRGSNSSGKYKVVLVHLIAAYSYLRK